MIVSDSASILSVQIHLGTNLFITECGSPTYSPMPLKHTLPKISILDSLGLSDFHQGVTKEDF